MAERKSAKIKLGYESPAIDFDKHDTGSLLVDIEKHIKILNDAIEKLQAIYDEIQDCETDISMGGAKDIDYIKIRGPKTLIDDMKAKGLVKYANEESDSESDSDDDDEEEVEEE